MKKKYLLLLDKVLELDAGTLTGTEELSDLDSWDSLAVLGFIAAVDKEFNLVLSPDDINKARTVDELVDLLISKL